MRAGGSKGMSVVEDGVGDVEDAYKSSQITNVPVHIVLDDEVVCRTRCSDKTGVRLQEELLEVGRHDGGVDEGTWLAVLSSTLHVSIVNGIEARVVAFRDHDCRELEIRLDLLTLLDGLVRSTNGGDLVADDLAELSLGDAVAVVDDLLGQRSSAFGVAAVLGRDHVVQVSREAFLDHRFDVLNDLLKLILCQYLRDSVFYLPLGLFCLDFGGALIRGICHRMRPQTQPWPR
jgi:hypothetical protein